LSHEIHKVRVRTALKPRREPYWGPAIADDLAVGYRKIDDTTGSWIARMRNDDPPPRYKYRSLGLASDASDYEAARTSALKWRESADAGVTEDGFTVADACREYVDDRRREKGEGTAHDAEKRFERTVYGTTFGATQLARLKTPRIKAWREGLGLSKGSANRTRTSLVAALNLAVANRRVHPAAAQEWRDVKPHKNTSKRREVFLDIGQRRALLARTQDGLHDLIEAAALTGARPGELVNAKRRQFDERTRMVTFTGKTGTRTVPVSDPALVLFRRLAKDKLPAAHLFVRADGRPWAHSDWDELIREAAHLARLPDGVCLYSLRHSWITEALLAGMATLDVARLVGTSVMMIEKHYGHLVASAARERLAGVVML
jgi:integrase